jgi:hypothetical protein
MPNGPNNNNNNNTNNNNNATVPATPNSPNNGNGNGTRNKNNAKSQSSAEGTRRVNPKTGKAKTKAQIQAAVMMKRAKKVLNDALGIKSTVSEFNPIIKLIKRENFANENSRKAAVNAYIEEIRLKRSLGTKKVKTSTSTPKTANTTVTNKPKRKYVRKVKAENTAAAPAPAAASPVVAPVVASGEKKPKRKVENPSASQSQYKTNMAAAKKLLNNTLSIKSMPPEHNPLVGIMRKEYGSEAEKQAAINAHVEKIRAARTEKASKKSAKGGSKTRKNRS